MCVLYMCAFEYIAVWTEVKAVGDEHLHVCVNV